LGGGVNVKGRYRRGCVQGRVHAFSRGEFRDLAVEAELRRSGCLYDTGGGVQRL